MKFRKSLTLLGLFILAGAVLSACGRESKRNPSSTSGSGPIRWESFPVSLYVDKAILNDTESKADLEGAINFWQSKANRSIFQIQGEWDSSAKPFSGSADSPGDLFNNVLYFQSPWDMGAQVAGKTILHSSNFRVTNAIILINPNTEFCSANCEKTGDAARTSRRKLFAHELGHFIGISHSDSTTDIMYPEILPGGDLSTLTINQGDLLRVTQ